MQYLIYSLKLPNMHAECYFEVMTYISISKRAGHAGKATCVHMDYVSWSGNPLQGIVV